MITIHIPNGAVTPDLQKEYTSARNIKDKHTRDETLAGLNSIQHYI